MVAWAAVLGWINLDGTWAQWLGHPITVAVLTVLAVGELVTDQLPKTPSRLVPMQFVTRLVTGGFSGAVLATGAVLIPGVGRLGARCGHDRCRAGHAGRSQARKRLVAANGGRDLPVALTEDAVAVIGGFAIVALAAVI